MAERFKTYLFSYSYQGSRWSFEIKATSAEDAKARLAAMNWATYDGEIYASIPVGPGAWADTLRNLWRMVWA